MEGFFHLGSLMMSLGKMLKNVSFCFSQVKKEGFALPFFTFRACGIEETLSGEIRQHPIQYTLRTHQMYH